VNQLPSALLLLITLISGEVEIVLEYEGIPTQCSKYSGVDHGTKNCQNTLQKTQKPKQTRLVKLGLNKPKTSNLNTNKKNTSRESATPHGQEGADATQNDEH
jgi:hypothetical protein